MTKLNKLEQMHLDAITGAEYDPEDKQPNYVGFAEECSKVTEQIAIEFADYYFRERYNENIYLECRTSEQIFQEFLKTKQ